MDNVDGITQLLSILLIGMVVVLVILIFVYFVMMLKNSKKKKLDKQEKLGKNTNIKNENEKTKAKTYKEFTKECIFDFLEFEKIEDNMIVQKNDKYLMVIECQGINFDLMSEMEQVSVEQGFMQFLNSLRFPIQLYIQTRTVNLQGSINGYKSKLEVIENKYRNMQMEYNDMLKLGSYTQKEIQRAYYELIKQRNLYEYTLDIIKNTERMSLNHNVLNKKYYIVISYDNVDLEGNDYTKDEKQNMAFSELYTKAQSIIRTLVSCEISSKILNSEGLAELLYNAYNREDADVLNIERAFQSGYEDLYSTAPDVLDKKMDLLNKEINKRAEKLAQEKVEEVKNEKEKRIFEKEENIEDLIMELAQDLIKENSRYIGENTADEAINKIQEDKENSKGGNKDEKESSSTRRGRPRKY